MVSDTTLGFIVIGIFLLLLGASGFLLYHYFKNRPKTPPKKGKTSSRGGFSKAESEAIYWTGGENN